MYVLSKETRFTPNLLLGICKVITRIQSKPGDEVGTLDFLKTGSYFVVDSGPELTM